MKQERNSARPGNGPAQGHPAQCEQPDALAEAEGLRAALAEALARAGRLVAALKAGRKEKKALASVWSGLKRHFGGE